MSLADNLRSFRPEPGFQFADLYTVANLGDDSRSVVISDGNPGSERAVPCAASYSGRAVGDVVLAVQLSGGSWLVLCKIGADDSAGPYVPTVLATTARGYLSADDAESDTPRAGAASTTDADWFGAWFYGGGIAAACVGKTVATMRVRIARGSGGYNGPTLLRLGLHSSTGPRPTINNQWVPGVSLSRGGVATIDIPSLQRSLLASGAATGIAVWGTGPTEYAIYTAPADVSITFA